MHTVVFFIFSLLHETINVMVDLNLLILYSFHHSPFREYIDPTLPEQNKHKMC